jgi:hypothetical protein
MNNNEKEKQRRDVDEKHIMAMIAQGVRKPGQLETGDENDKEAPENTVQDPIEEKPAIREKNRSKKASDTTYGDRFLSSHSLERRGEKCIYIRTEYHERLSRIVQVIGEDKIPLYAYLDNILEHHFDLFEKAITEDFNKKYKPIF